MVLSGGYTLESPGDHFQSQSRGSIPDQLSQDLWGWDQESVLLDTDSNLQPNLKPVVEYTLGRADSWNWTV